tara:strand:+ start:503 stop:742 length:240 start_codon:yes stop_codon:yes gene_type:complete
MLCIEDLSMTDKRAEIKAHATSVVFITKDCLERKPDTWCNDPRHPTAMAEFLAECEINGWPIFVHDGTAYIFAGEGAQI